MKNGKRPTTERMQQTHPEKSECSKKGNLKIIGNIGNRHHRKSGDERKNKIEYLRGTRKLLKNKLRSRNLN